MVRGLYTAATGMMVQRNKMDVLTNNLVNAETTGFKKDTLVTTTFNEEIIKRLNDPSVKVYGGVDVGPYSYGTHVDEIITDFSSGAFEGTGVSTDLAITGDGFFTIETEEGVRYTRSGNFSVDGNGYLVTADGHYVLGTEGRINIGTTEFEVLANGVINVDGRNVGRLRIETFEDEGVLRKEGNNLYYAYGGAAAVPANGAVVRQGMQELSNVNVIDEITDMITVYRKYEASQKIVSITDESLGLAVKLGSLGG